MHFLRFLTLRWQRCLKYLAIPGFVCTVSFQGVIFQSINLCTAIFIKSPLVYFALPEIEWIWLHPVKEQLTNPNETTAKHSFGFCGVCCFYFQKLSFYRHRNMQLVLMDTHVYEMIVAIRNFMLFVIAIMATPLRYTKLVNFLSHPRILLRWRLI